MENDEKLRGRLDQRQIWALVSDYYVKRESRKKLWMNLRNNHGLHNPLQGKPKRDVV